MAENTSIEWCDSTFNPWTGCTKVSPGCDHCYAEGWSKRAGPKVGKWGPGAPRVRTTPANWRKPLAWDARDFRECGCGWRGDESGTGEQTPDGYRICPNCGALFEQMAVTRRRVFCASLADVFDNEVPVEWRVDLLDLIRRCQNIDFLLLTKRIGNVSRMIREAMEHVDEHEGGASDGFAPYEWMEQWQRGNPPSNVWLGATFANREEMLRDGPKLKAVDAAVRFWSVEPMLGPLGEIPHDLLPDWVICGGESGPGARPMHPDWVRSLRDQCEAAGVPFMFKQHGEWLATAFCDDDAAMIPSRRTVYVNRDGSYSDGSEGIDFFHGAEETAWVGKKAAGRLLDGRTHDGFPEVNHG